MTNQIELCQLCALPAEALLKLHGATTCRSCITLFWFAEVLLDTDVLEEEIVSTLAFARYAEALWDIRDSEHRAVTARQLVAQYPAFELVKVVDGVPVLRMKHALVDVTKYQGSNLAKSVRIRVFSRFAEPDTLAKLYWDTCQREGLPIHATSAGCLSWALDHTHLVVDVGPREQIEPARISEYANYPHVRRFAFPLDSIVEKLLRALLGWGQSKNLMFGAVLSDLGRHKTMSPETIVTACVLWDIRGERSPSRVRRSEEVTELINRLLLAPLDKELITVSSNDAVWRDAKKVSHRFDLCKYLLQETRD